jgi:phosphatidylserine decarboxylase
MTRPSDLFRSAGEDMVRDGIHYSLALLFLGLFAAYWGGPVWGVPAWLLAAFVLYFFRDPERLVPAGNVVVSPADGKVVDVREIDLDGRRAWKISIFLSVFDVHVNRSPLAGTIRGLRYQPGRFLMAFRPEASVENEQNTVTVEGDGVTVVFKQIAGTIARRIVFRKRLGDSVERGERVGLIKFGSRVDVFLPIETPPAVVVGDRVAGGSSVLARLNPPR